MGTVDYLWFQLEPVDGTRAIMQAYIKIHNLYGGKVQVSWDVLTTLELNVLDTLEKDPQFSF